MRFPQQKIFGFLFALALTWSAAAPAVENSTGAAGVVYVMTNRASANSVMVFSRATDGSLRQVQEVSTRGLGTGFTLDPLTSQGSLTLGSDGKFLFAVNAGSGELTSFTVTADGLAFARKISSRGAFPVSVASSGGLVYVVNELGVANIVGFTVDSAGHLQNIPGSTRMLAGGALAQPAQVRFTPDGSLLIVTEKGTDQRYLQRAIGWPDNWARCRTL